MGTTSLHSQHKGFSLRQSLVDNGVTTEDGVRAHLHHVYGTLQAVPQLRIAQYRPDKSNPNVINHG